MNAPNFFSSGPVDRASERRKDTVWVANQFNHPDAVMVPVWRSRNLVKNGDPMEPVFPRVGAITEMDRSETAFLGLIDGIPHFAQDLSVYDETPLTEWGEFVDLRDIGQLLERNAAALLAYARGLMFWHSRHRFCSVCGSPAAMEEAGHLRLCTNHDCRASHFPRTDPAVIMLVHDGGDRVILGRQKIWPTGMHSVLAGFVEPGESLEDAVAREVFEEVGVPIDQVAYQSSQPWPFPASIMLGFWARARSDTINVNRLELEDARWYSRSELLASPEDRSFKLPRRVSIARRLLEDWLRR